MEEHVLSGFKNAFLNERLKGAQETITKHRNKENEIDTDIVATSLFFEYLFCRLSAICVFHNFRGKLSR